MIATKTPFRVTFGGGGTDLPSFYEKHGGYVVAGAIDRFMYVLLNVPCADRLVRLHSTRSEVVGSVRELRHELAREALMRHGIADNVEVSSLADVPAGTGLGSSSCYLVGLLLAIRTHLGLPASPSALAEEACAIEIEALRKPIGKQDQYLAAFGDLTELHIARDGTVRVERIALPAEALGELSSACHLYFTNVTRSAADILDDQDSALRAGRSDVEATLVEILQIGKAIGSAIRAADFDRFGELMHEHWTAKKRLSTKVSVDPMEEIYDFVRSEFGVIGGKVAGAGGGGFMMLYLPGSGEDLTRFMESRGFGRLTWNIAPRGSTAFAI